MGVFVITGPSGVGKGTVISALCQRIPELRVSVSATTRNPRANEKDGREYHFLTEGEFQERVQNNLFLEHARYSGYRYGTLQSELDRRLGDGFPIVLEVDLQGARQLRNSLPQAKQVFIAPPNKDELRDRLLERGTESPASVKRRLAAAQDELSAQSEFSFVVVNDNLQDAVDELESWVRDQLKTESSDGATPSGGLCR